MNGIHDCGGVDGFGPVVVEADEPVWRADWERTVFSFFPQAAVAGYFNRDEFRDALEWMDPVDYLVTPYYAHWMHAVETLITRGDPGLAEEIERRTQQFLQDPERPLPATVNHDLADAIVAMYESGVQDQRALEAAPAFRVGDRVAVTTEVPVRHTRKAGYVRGKTGDVVLEHGGWVFPDSHAHGRGEAPEYVYSVSFSSEELFGAGIGDPSARVTIDLWESYLTRAA